MKTVNKKKRKLPNLVTVWKKDEDNIDRFGNPAHSAPMYIWTRYQQSSKLYRTSDGREVRSNAQVFSDVPVGDYGDYVYLGYSESETPPNTSQEVQDVRVSPTLSGNREEHRVLL